MLQMTCIAKKENSASVWAKQSEKQEEKEGLAWPPIFELNKSKLIPVIHGEIILARCSICCISLVRMMSFMIQQR